MHQELKSDLNLCASDLRMPQQRRHVPTHRTPLQTFLPSASPGESTLPEPQTSPCPAAWLLWLSLREPLPRPFLWLLKAPLVSLFPICSRSSWNPASRCGGKKITQCFGWRAWLDESAELSSKRGLHSGHPTVSGAAPASRHQQQSPGQPRNLIQRQLWGR